MIGRPGGHRVAKRSWIVVLASIPTANGRPAALSFARGARRSVGGLSILNSSNRASLRGGYWVVYSGPYGTLQTVTQRAARDPRGRPRHGLRPRGARVPMKRLKTRLRAEEGMTLIELLIAMTIMSVGIAALVAGFSTGIVSITRANVTSTAGTLADKQMETFRQASYATVQSKPTRRSTARMVTGTGYRATFPRARLRWGRLPAAPRSRQAVPSSS